MTISTYAELKTAIGTYSRRAGHADVTGNAADFVTLGEARLNRALTAARKNLLNDTSLTGTTDSRSVALPSDFVAPVALFLTTSGDHIELKPKVAGTFAYGTTSGTPIAWCINGDNIDLDRPCDQAHTFLLRYRKKLDALSDNSTTNWLLTKHPDAYLAACLVEYFMFDQQEERAAVWQQRMNTAIQEINVTDARSQAVATLAVDAALTPAPYFDYTTGQ